MIKKLIAFIYKKYCHQYVMELLAELQRAHIRDIVTRVDRNALLRAIEDNESDSISIVDIVVKSFTDNNYFK